MSCPRCISQDTLTEPASSFGSALVANATHVVSFGGYSGDGITLATPGAYSLLSTAFTPQTTFTGSALAVRGGAVAAGATPGTTYVFGGVNALNAFTNGVVVVTALGATPLAVVNTTLPPVRRLAAAAYLPKCYSNSAALPGATGACLVVFGGLAPGNVMLGDLWVLDMRVTPATWSSPTQTGPAPTARHSASAVASGDGTFAAFFGGMTATAPSNDIFTFAPGGFATPATSEMYNLARPNGVEAATAQSSTGACRDSHDSTCDLADCVPTCDACDHGVAAGVPTHTHVLYMYMHVLRAVVPWP